jgi:hypothetical protein
MPLALGLPDLLQWVRGQRAADSFELAQGELRRHGLLV